MDSTFCAEFDADSKTVLVFLLALIVFDLFSFEGSKTHFTGEANVYRRFNAIVSQLKISLF